MKITRMAAVVAPLVLIAAPAALASTTTTTVPVIDPTTPPFRIVAHPLTTRDLQVVVLSTPDAQAVASHPSASSFAEVLRRKFKQAGFKGDICLLAETDQPLPALPRLEIHLSEWKVLPGREVDCNFEATLTTPGQQAELGTFTGKAVDVDPPRNRRARAQEFKKAAGDAIAQLYRRLHQQDLLASHA